MARTYDSNGNFEYDKYVYPFKTARVITVEEYALGYTAPDYLAGKPSPLDNQQPAPDQPSTWAASSVNSTIKADLVPAYLQSAYTQTTTRAEFCALAVNLYETTFDTAISGRATFTDTKDVNVEKMAYIGVVNGVGDGKFAPNSPLTREQAATILARLASIMGYPLPYQAPYFADNSLISTWATDAVGQMQASGIMGGVGDNRFSPKTPYTREQSITTILRLYDSIELYYQISGIDRVKVITPASV